MILITFILYFLLLLSFFLNFEKKVSLLLILEGMMLILLWSSLYYHTFQIGSCFFVMLLSIFMVLDSVLGMTLMIFSNKASSIESFGFMGF